MKNEVMPPLVTRSIALPSRAAVLVVLHSTFIVLYSTFIARHSSRNPCPLKFEVDARVSVHPNAVIVEGATTQ
jgi:hypothetical protein